MVYASIKEHSFTPIVDAGPHALFLGTYLPGGGNQFIDVSVTAKEVCAFFNMRHLDPRSAQSCRCHATTATCRPATPRVCSR